MIEIYHTDVVIVCYSSHMLCTVVLF